jgi:hypothetical protein
MDYRHADNLLPVDQTDRMPLSRTFGAHPRAIVVFWNGGSSEVPLDESTTSVVIGRATDTEVCIPQGSVSRKHARIHLSAMGVEVEDLGSMNGTRVSGAEVSSGTRMRVPVGAVVEVGDAILLLRYEPEGAEDPDETNPRGYRPPIAALPHTHIVETPPLSRSLADTAPPTHRGLQDELASLEKQRILQALMQTSGNQKKAAELLGMTRRALTYRLKLHNIPGPRRR